MTFDNRRDFMRALALGILAAALFSSTFVLNSWLSAGGSHWYWTATLRYVWVWAILTVAMALRGRLGGLLHIFLAYGRLWLTAGSVGFALFYLLLCRASVTLEGWVVATSWQITPIASVAVVTLLSGRLPMFSLGAAVAIFVGVFLVNGLGDGVGVSEGIVAAIPVLAAAFCYPFGNQLVLRATTPGGPSTGRFPMPAVRDEAAREPFSQVWLMTTGALPMLALWGMYLSPPAPTLKQVGTTAFVGFVTGVLGTAAFLKARGLTRTPYQTAAVDATQSAEVPFALLIEVALFGGAIPTLGEWLGVLLVLGGLISLILYCRPNS